MAEEQQTTLPPFHTLLPTFSVKFAEAQEPLSPTEPFFPLSRTFKHHRRTHSSSSARTPSPTPPKHSTKPTSNAASVSLKQGPSQNFRLVPTTLENADAILFVPPPSIMSTDVPSISNFARKGRPSEPQETKPSSKGRALLLVGPAMGRIRGLKITNGARVHPYKILRQKPSLKTSQHDHHSQ